MCKCTDLPASPCFFPPVYVTVRSCHEISPFATAVFKVI